MFKKGQVWERNDDFFTVINIHPDHPNEALIQAKDGRKLWINIHIAEALGYKLKKDHYNGELMKERVCKCVPFEEAELSGVQYYLYLGKVKDIWYIFGIGNTAKKAEGAGIWNIEAAKNAGINVTEEMGTRGTISEYRSWETLLGVPREELEGIVISEEVARLSPCMRVKGTDLVFTKGVVGALNEKQRAEYCPTIIEVERPKFEARIERWKNAINTCKERTKHLTGGEKLKQYVNCMSTEAGKD